MDEPGHLDVISREEWNLWSAHRRGVQRDEERDRRKRSAQQRERRELAGLAASLPRLQARIDLLREVLRRRADERRAA